MTLPLAALPSAELGYSLLSPEEKLSLCRGIHSHHWKGAPLVFLGVITLVVSIALLLIGSLLLGYPLEGFSFVSDVFLPFLLPAILALVGVAAPLLMLAFQQHSGALAKHKKLAESNYLQILNYCKNQTKKITKQEVAAFIEASVALPEYSRRFFSVTLLQTSKVIPGKGSSHTSLHDEIIAEGILYARDSIYMSQYEKEKRDRVDAEEEEERSASMQPEPSSVVNAMLK
ncbi:hypothetical protein [Chlamydia vaughanii]|uniref:hypothetical protein n=1 Tax=Chlamydia vaughanii TaxID=3112552 RepID=UPI0032B27F09